ncbi:MAG: PAS domain S-box protein [Lentisphaeria bacterium]|nr:PAS domain S-box protein [Lentisphaeria bacterium]
MTELFSSGIVFSYALIWLESTFILASLLILHSLRKHIGSPPLFFTFGVIIMFAHFMAASGVRFLSTNQAVDLGVSSTAIMIPSLAILLVIYIVDGTLSAQRIIIAEMAGFGMLFYLRYIGALECSAPDFAYSNSLMANLFRQLLNGTTKHMASSTIALTFDLFLIPMIFQQMRNRKFNMFVSVMLAILVGQLFDSIIFLCVFYWGTPKAILEFWPRLLPQVFLAIWLSIITTIYLHRIRHEVPKDKRSPLDIIVAFFGAYSQSKLLEQTLQESEQRCRTIIQNAADLIFVSDSNGTVIDANHAALKACGLSTISDAIGENLQKLAGLSIPDPEKEQLKDGSILRAKLPGKETELEFLINRIYFSGMPAYVFIGRDITERVRIAREREAWRTEHAHRQRLEAIGRLAGGIAHDFNNHLHAIQGHLDLIYMEGASEENMPHLEKIDNISQQAAKLTGQLLGYARKGRRQNQILDLNKVLSNAKELFLPDSRAGINIKSFYADKTIQVLGDETQLNQAVLNLIINARDAMENLPEDQRKLSISADTLENLQVTPVPPAELKNIEETRWCGIRVKDSGPGVPKDLSEKIFEPFFTTKPTGKGTGMGLSMSYGVALEHNGWIQYDYDGTGAAFTLILPIVENNDFKN